jgi:16S rRNA (guanine527-N7)-methyltransferase
MRSMADAARHEELAGGVAALGIVLPTDAIDRLASFAHLLVERAIPLGMVGRDDADRIVERHLIDSLRAVRPLSELGAARVVDLGSGAGLPGLPLALALSDTTFTLAEQRSKRAAFLELAVESLGLANAIVHPGGAEALSGRSFDAATARAFAPPATAWEVARPLLRPQGALVLFAGAAASTPEKLEGAGLIEVVPASPELRSWRSSGSTPLATVGDLVIIRST